MMPGPDLPEYDYWFEYDCGPGVYGAIILSAPGTIATTSSNESWPLPFEQWMGAMKQLIREANPQASDARLMRRRSGQVHTSELVGSVNL